MADRIDIFDRALAFTLQHEGGYVNDPNDPGGETKYGISKRSYPHLDIKGLTIEEARHIYFRDFWIKPGVWRLADVAPDLARRLFDLGVNCGPANAARMLQRGINAGFAQVELPRRRSPWRQKLARLLKGGVLRVDGDCGPITAEVVSAIPYRDAILSALVGEAYNHYVKLDPAYRPSWLLRLGSPC